ncbi:MAG: hypothetical protein WC992_00215 [Acholeplasmataceae bacterium]
MFLKMRTVIRVVGKKTFRLLINTGYGKNLAPGSVYIVDGHLESCVNRKLLVTALAAEVRNKNIDLDHQVLRDGEWVSVEALLQTGEKTAGRAVAATDLLTPDGRAEIDRVAAATVPTTSEPEKAAEPAEADDPEEPEIDEVEPDTEAAEETEIDEVEPDTEAAEETEIDEVEPDTEAAEETETGTEDDSGFGLLEQGGEVL